MLAAPLQVLSVQHHQQQQHQQVIPFGCFQQPKQNRVQHRHSQQRPQIPGQQLAKPSRSSPRKVYKVGGGLPKAQPFHQQQLQQSSMQELQRSRPPFPPELLPNAAKFRNMQG